MLMDKAHSNLAKSLGMRYEPDWSYLIILSGGIVFCLVLLVLFWHLFA